MAATAPPPLTPRNPDYAARTRAGIAAQGAMAALGVGVAEVAPGRVVLTLPFRAELTQQHGFIHAGILTTVVDSACGFAAFTLFDASDEVLTAEFKVSFMAPARGQAFRCTGQVIRAGRRLTFTEGSVVAIDDDRETEVARMSATMMATRVREGA